jgi:prepilin-type processing-associated H-X9-DG protein
LIELLVVIAIIAILAAILFPVFAKAREKARQSSCASNEKQLGLSIMQYKQDYDETYPLNYSAGDGTILVCGNPAYWWMDELKPYVKNKQVWICPSNPGFRCNSTPRDPVANPADPYSYGYSTAASGAKDSDMRIPSATLIVGEVRVQSCIPSCCTNLWIAPGAAPDDGPILIAPHSGMFNGVYGDGHVKASKDRRPRGTSNPSWTLAED